MSLLLAAGSSGFTGTITATQDANTASLSGSVVVSGVSGAITASQAANTASLTGAETFSGAITASQAANTAALTGVETFSGAISATQAGNTASATGGQTFSGSITALQGANTAALSGSVSGAGVSGSISATQDANTAALSGSVTSSAVSGVITATQGDNTASLTGSGGQTAAGGYDDKPKKRFIVEKNGKLLVYSTAQAAVNADLNAVQSRSEGVGGKQPKQAFKPHPQDEKEVVRPQIDDVKPEVIDLTAVQEYARIAGLIEQYNAAYRSAHYEALIALFEQMQDEDDIEMLLLGA